MGRWARWLTTGCGGENGKRCTQPAAPNNGTDRDGRSGSSLGSRDTNKPANLRPVGTGRTSGPYLTRKCADFESSLRTSVISSNKVSVKGIAGVQEKERHLMLTFQYLLPKSRIAIHTTAYFIFATTDACSHSGKSLRISSMSCKSAHK